MGLDDKRLKRFVRESNRIENITREPTDEEVDAHRRILQLEEVTIPDVTAFVLMVAGGLLRVTPGMNVQVGNHRPPPGSPAIEARLFELLQALPASDTILWHTQYETLHPFTDGNGRSGRALWLWRMVRTGYDGRYDFLRAWYYQSLEAVRSLRG